MFTSGFSKTAGDDKKEKRIAGAMHSVNPLAGATYSAMQHPKKSVMPFLVSGAGGLLGLAAGKHTGRILSNIAHIESPAKRAIIKGMLGALGAYYAGAKGHELSSK
jgi:hypothetical protein